MINIARACRTIVAGTFLAATSAGAQTQPPWSITVGPETQLDIGGIRNAPNGHISHQKRNDTLTLWVDGRVMDGSPKGLQGTFLLSIHPASWSSTALTSASPTNVFKATHDTANHDCRAPDSWYRNYAAINAVIPGPQRGQLLAFVDGEFHPDTTGTPLQASIGIATSSDGKVWSNRQVIIRGHNMVAAKFDCNHVNALMKTRKDNVGAAGPSAVIRTDGNTKYIYLYYLDRVLADDSVTPRVAASAGIYVARQRYADAGVAGKWEFWTPKGWSPAGAEVVGEAVVNSPVTGTEAAQPQVTYNTALRRWLMVFHSRGDLYAASSSDGVKWDSPQPLHAATRGNRSPAFPTIVDSTSTDQLTTGATGILFYSREQDTTATSNRKTYPGYVRSFTITTAPPVVRKPPCGTPMQCCQANGGTWSGGRCK